MAHAITKKNDIETLVVVVRREFEEMPGLVLTADQARRLWAIEPRMCSVVLDRLVGAGYLHQTPSGHYVKPSAA